MKKLFALLTILILLVSCSQTPKETKKFKVLSPSGAPAVSLIPYLKEDASLVEIVSGPDNLQAALVNPNSEYDVIIAPINLWGKLATSNSTTYKLHSVVTWGNLFLVKNNASDAVKKVAAFGEQAVPGVIFKNVQAQLNIDGAEIQWVPSVAEAQALLLSNQVDAALLAQPLVAATMAKAKQENIDLSILSNLQEVYGKQFGTDNYPQAALLVSEDVAENNLDDVNAFVKVLSDYTSSIVDKSEDFIQDVDAVGAEKLGIPNGQIIVNAFEQLGLNIKSAKDVPSEIEAFLKLFKIESVDAFTLK